MSDPQCACGEYWPGQGHPPDCPVRQEIDRLRARVAELQAESTRYREGLENLLCEISLPAWSDPRIPYDEVQVTKGAIAAANLALEDPACAEAMEEGHE